uniref:Uncharacterized protein n=1 Tax=Romanomermis culicivorax TaxID=13658 RepID=A0A915IGA3_ROMCU
MFWHKETLLGELRHEQAAISYSRRNDTVEEPTWSKNRNGRKNDMVGETPHNHDFYILGTKLCFSYLTGKQCDILIRVEVKQLGSICTGYRNKSHRVNYSSVLQKTRKHASQKSISENLIAKLKQ